MMRPDRCRRLESSIDNAASLEDFQELARARMDPGAFDYVAGGALNEITLEENVTAFRRRRLRPRILVDVSRIDCTTTFLGGGVSMPVGLAPAALAGLAHPEGEAAIARAATRAGVVYCVPTLSTRSIEEVAEAGGPRWFQLYVYKDRGISAEVVRRAEAAGYGAVVLTVDVPVVGFRERDHRNRFGVPPELFANVTIAGGKELTDVINHVHDATFSWDDLSWVRSLSRLPLILKGVLTAEDTILALDHGVDAVIVSNHGGRQLDRARPSVDALEEVAAAAAGRCEVYLDSGVRRGVDVLVALALGARGVFLGRPYLYALAAGGESGVDHCLHLMRTELENAMALLGVTSPAQVGRAHLV